MRLCDESLCGDVTALAARLDRLEAGGIPAARSAAPIPQQTTPRQNPAPVREKPAAKPVQDDRPPWEDAPPLPDAPPWDEPAPIPMDYDAPPPYGEPVAAKPMEPASVRSAPVKSAPKAAPKVVSKPAAPAASGIWQELIERYKERLMPMYWFMLDDAQGYMDGDTLVVCCGDDLTMETLNVDSVTEVLSTVTGEKLGRTVRVRYTLDKPVAAANEPPRDKMEDLIRAGSKFDGFIVK